MKFKISSYIASSEPIETAADGKRKRVVFSTRTSQGLVMTDFLFEKISQGETDLIPLDIFTKLTSYEIIVPQNEDECKTVLQRRLADLKDQQVNRIFISPDGNNFYERLKRYIGDNWLQSVTFCLPVTSETIGDLDKVIYQLKLVAKSIEFRIKLFINLSDITDGYFSHLIQSPLVSELELNVGDLPYQNNLARIQQCLEEARRNERQITLRMVLNQHDSQLDSFFRMLALYKENCSLFFFRLPEMDRAKFAELETHFLSVLKSFGIKTQYLPSWSCGVYSIADSIGAICNADDLDSRGILSFNSQLILSAHPTSEEVYKVTTGGTPCADCFALPVCGGASSEAWRHAGKDICPSYIENLPARAKMFYTKANG